MLTTCTTMGMAPLVKFPLILKLQNTTIVDGLEILASWQSTTDCGSVKKTSEKTWGKTFSEVQRGRQRHNVEMETSIQLLGKKIDSD